MILLIYNCQMNMSFLMLKGTTGLSGEAERNTRGRIRSIADATDERDNILKERGFPAFVVT